MNFQEILQSLRNNGFSHIADTIERKMVDDRLCGNDRIEELYGDVITQYLHDNIPLTPEEVILSPDFALLRSVASIMASYMPMIEIEVELE